MAHRPATVRLELGPVDIQIRSLKATSVPKCPHAPEVSAVKNTTGVNHRHFVYCFHCGLETHHRRRDAAFKAAREHEAMSGLADVMIFDMMAHNGRANTWKPDGEVLRHRDTSEPPPDGAVSAEEAGFGQGQCVPDKDPAIARR